MATVEITDDCNSPDRYIRMNYSGPDPWGAVKKINASLRGFFHISATNTSNDRLNWDISGDPIHFWSTWWVTTPMSSRTYAVIFIQCQGFKYKATNTGKFSLTLYADLRTKFSAPGFLLKPMWYTYSYFFYNRARRRFLGKCRDLVLNFKNEIKEHYNMGTTTVPGAHSVFG
jgi:hypothetical protein